MRQPTKQTSLPPWFRLLFLRSLRPSWPLGFPLALLLAVPLVQIPSNDARACGGFFCNRPGNPFDPPPVVQTAENVLFAVNPSPGPGTKRLEAHIQIFYSGPAAAFSWILPVDAEPTLDVGSDAVFTTLDGLTRPRFQVTYHDEGICKAPTGGQGATDSTCPTCAIPGTAAPAPSAGGTVDVSFRGAVGPFDAAVIHSADPEALKDWLRTNNYFISDQAAGLIDVYVQEGKYFVALKLLNGVDVQSIRPIILRFDAPSPCVPLRLTAIAAIADLRVNLWVLGAQRTVPLNFLELAVNQSKIDWFAGGTNYDKLLSEAANEAGGNAFAAEYAGTASILARQLWFDGKFNLPRLRAAQTPPAYMNELAAQAVPRDAKLLVLLEKYIPEPASLVAMGVSERDFYNRIANYWQTIAPQFAPFDPNAFTDELDVTVVAPLASAQVLFDSYSYLTRLATFISPEEMTKDPIFGFNYDLGDVPLGRVADAVYECGNMQYSHCDAPIRLRLPDGRTLRYKPLPSAVCYGRAAGYERGDLDALPSLEASWLRAETGPGHPITDNGTTIDTMVDRHNAALQTGCGCAHAGVGEESRPTGVMVLFGAAVLAILRLRRPLDRRLRHPLRRVLRDILRGRCS